jgi:predicted nucleotidyltransferase
MDMSKAIPHGLAQALFSNVQQRVLALIFGQPERSFYASELIRLVGSGSGAVQRELARLEKSSLVITTRTGNQKHYTANRNSPIFEELRSLVLKTVALVEPLREALDPFRDRIEAAFVFGSVARGEDTASSDIDLMIVGHDLDYPGIFAALQRSEALLSRTVNPIIMTPAQWKRKTLQDSNFVSNLSRQPKYFVIGSDEELRRWGSQPSTTS